MLRLKKRAKKSGATQAPPFVEPYVPTTPTPLIPSQTAGDASLAAPSCPSDFQTWTPLFASELLLLSAASLPLEQDNLSSHSPAPFPGFGKFTPSPGYSDLSVLTAQTAVRDDHDKSEVVLLYRPTPRRTAVLPSSSRSPSPSPDSPISRRAYQGQSMWPPYPSTPSPNSVSTSSTSSSSTSPDSQVAEGVPGRESPSSSRILSPSNSIASSSSSSTSPDVSTSSPVDDSWRNGFKPWG